ncbi:hypothetical protein HP2RS_05241 [Helicobacter pylori]|nr:hypothetical protein HP2RS_05241 [Helicobacter pylori]
MFFLWFLWLGFFEFFHTAFLAIAWVIAWLVFSFDEENS